MQCDVVVQNQGYAVLYPKEAAVSCKGDDPDSAFALEFYGDAGLSRVGEGLGCKALVCAYFKDIGVAADGVA